MRSLLYDKERRLTTEQCLAGARRTTMSTEDHLHRLESAMISIIFDVSGIRVELRRLRYIMLAILGLLLRNTFWPG